MNVASRSFESTKNGFFVSFNQDCSSLAVSTNSGYRILSLNAIDSLVEICENATEDICIVERLFSSSLLAIVSLSSPRKLKVCHFKKGSEICNYSYSNTILAVKLNRVRLVVCLEESLYIHNIRDMKVLHTIRDTPPNPNGLCALSTDSENCFLAYPGSSTIGEVQIFDAVILQCKMMIAAHDSPLAAMIFSPSGHLIATASEKGTVIRVFNVADGNKLFEFRRGVKRCVNIFGLAFSPDAAFLAAASNTETVHVFKLDNPKDAPAATASGSSDEGASSGWMGYLSKAVCVGANYLPTQVTGVFNQGRAFASAHLPHHGYRNVCALTQVQKVLRLLVASSDGTFYIYNLDVVDGGDCNLIKQHKLLKICDSVPEIPLSANLLPDESSGSHRGSTDSKDSTNTGSISSYAGILKGHPSGVMSDSEKFHEMSAATAPPEKDGLQLNDEVEFPPVSLTSN
ncbi:WD repeat domain phosphoinositide-interacting protein [Nesidiocoris tenuis]|uniref:WD repeat domain phosphoinositide-interacting protein n=1 Tax=Nesidiocoris tenuis TaxID=355587 RepID=A0ABN7BHD7_9HEMI|nr:WD repeat domain phosphoinositide-interacting protein [Nesidiocoris tenuis]